jgi:hypothetical protein
MALGEESQVMEAKSRPVPRTFIDKTFRPGPKGRPAR